MTTTQVEGNLRLSQTKLPPNVRLLGTASFLNDVASEMIFPLLPAFLITELGGNRLHLGIIEGVADTVSSLLRLGSGAWSDRVGCRKAFVVFGYSVAAMVRPLSGLTVLPWHLFLVRTVDRIGKGVRTAPRDALIAESTDAAMRGRAFGFHQAMDHLGAAIGPLFAAWFLWNWPENLRQLFLLALLPGLAVVALVVFGLRETQVRPAPTEKLRPTPQPFDGRFLLYLLAVTIFTLGNSSDAFLLVRAGELGAPQWLLPFLWCAFHVVKSTSSWLAGLAADRLGPRVLLMFGWAAYGAVYLAFALANSAWQASGIFLAYGLVYSLTEPAAKAFVTRLTPAETKGLAFGWFHFAVGMSALPSSMIFGWLYEHLGSLIAFGWSGSLALIAAVLLAGVRAK